MVNLDKEKYEKNPNALACFRPERIHPDVPKLELRTHAFHTLENNVSVTKVDGSADRISPLVFEDVTILP